MNTGELDLALCEPTACGDPWHGYVLGGSLFLSESEVRSVPLPPDRGDCFVFRIPGLPVPTLTPDDVAKGHKWLNYALIAGRSRRLYGNNLGENAWLYLDDAGKVWRAVMSSAANVISLAMTDINDLAATGSGSATAAPYGTAFGQFWVLDVASDGRRVVLGEKTVWLDLIVFRAVELTISGPGAAPTISAAIILEQHNPAAAVPLTTTVDNVVVTLSYTLTWAAPTVEGQDTPPPVIAPYSYTLTQEEYANSVFPDPPPPNSTHTILVQSRLDSVVTNGSEYTDQVIGFIYDASDTRRPVKYRTQAIHEAATTNYNWGTIVSVSGTKHTDWLIINGITSGPTLRQTRVGSGTSFDITAGFYESMPVPFRMTNRLYTLAEWRPSLEKFFYYAMVSPAGASPNTALPGLPDVSYHPITDEIRVNYPSNGASGFI